MIRDTSSLGRLFEPSHWLNRIVVVLFLFAVAVVTVSLFIQMTPVSESEVAQPLAMLLIWSALYGVILFDERRQPAGVLVATGVIPTSKTTEQIIRGAIWALAMLGPLAVAGLLLGHYDVPADPLINPLVVVSIIAGAIGEELLFRATILRMLQDRFGTAWAIVLTSAVFAAAHMGNPESAHISSINTFLVALALATVVVKSGSIWTAAACHAVWNLVVALCFGALSGYNAGLSWLRLEADSGSSVSQLLLGNAYGIESGLACSIVIIISFAFLRHIIVVDPFVVAARYRTLFSRHNVPPYCSSSMEKTNAV